LFLFLLCSKFFFANFPIFYFFLIKCPLFKKQKKMQKCKLVILDCEMTGLDIYNDCLVQLAAVCGPHAFSTYIEPAMPMKPDAEAITGISDAMLKGQPRIAQALRMFSDWLRQLGTDVVLVAHCGMLSDFPLIWVEMERCGLDPAAMLPNVCGLFDTLIWARKWIRRDFLFGRTGSASCGLANLYHAWAGTPPSISHDALADCHTLRAVINWTGMQVKTPQAVKYLQGFTAQRKWKTPIDQTPAVSAKRPTFRLSAQIIQAQ
jgi:DNA polymerase III epsilon subunit-like protein